MSQSNLIYSLSNQLRFLNPNLSNDIKIVTIAGIQGSAIDINAIIFEESHIPQVLNFIETNSKSLNRFICISDNLSSDDSLALLNNNIECLTPDKFSQVNSNYFQLTQTKVQYKVLVVEDDETQLQITEQILKNAHINVVSVSKGKEVIRTLYTFNPDLILMDLYLDDETTGDELVKTIRREIKYMLLPIVFLTSDTSIETRMRVLNAGADDLLTKPINADLLVSALENRMQRSIEYQAEMPIDQSDTIKHNVEKVETGKLNLFFDENYNNTSTSIIWLKINNIHILQKELGYSGFRSLCNSLLDELPDFNVKFNIKKNIADGVWVFASNSMNNKDARNWIKEVKTWLSNNYFTVQENDYYITIATIILSDIPTKKHKQSLLHKAEKTLIDLNNSMQTIELEGEDENEKHFFNLKTQIENSIRTRNFKWKQQPIISIKDKTKVVYQISLIVVTSLGTELHSKDYFDVAIKTGMLKLLNRFTLERAIRIIRSNSQKNNTIITFLKQTFIDFKQKNLRIKLFETLQNLKLPKNSIVFQFSLNEAKEHMDILQDIGKELKQAKIKICLSDFESESLGWEVARMLQVNWIKLQYSHNNITILDEESYNYLPNVIRKAQVLCYQVLVSKVNDGDTLSSLKEIGLDYVQGSIIKP